MTPASDIAFEEVCGFIDTCVARTLSSAVAAAEAKRILLALKTAFGPQEKFVPVPDDVGPAVDKGLLLTWDDKVWHIELEIDERCRAEFFFWDRRAGGHDGTFEVGPNFPMLATEFGRDMPGGASRLVKLFRTYQSTEPRP